MILIGKDLGGFVRLKHWECVDIPMKIRGGEKKGEERIQKNCFGSRTNVQKSMTFQRSILLSLTLRNWSRRSKAW